MNGYTSRHAIVPPLVSARRTIAEIIDGKLFRYMNRTGLILEADNASYFRDHKPPFMIAAQSAITLAATDKLLYPGSLTAFPANYLWAGKGLMLTVYGTITTAATPGNLNIEFYYGTTDAGGTLLASSAALTLIASQTTIPFRIEAYLRCRSTGPTGSVLAWGQAFIGAAVVAAGGGLIPASAPAPVTIDTTQASGFNVQFKRSGSTAETATVQDLLFEAVN
jgi:hypothetical protein